MCNVIGMAKERKGKRASVVYISERDSSWVPEIITRTLS